MQKILFISHSSKLTGAPLLLWEIARRLDRSRFEPHFLLPEEGPLVERFRELGETSIEPIYPDELRYWREVKRVGRRIAFLRNLKPSIVYCNTIHPAKWLVYARMLGIPAITHVHELSMGFATLNWQEHEMIRNLTTRFIAVSDAVKEYLVKEQKIHPARIDVVRAGIDVERFSRQPDVSALRKELGLEGAFVVGTVGRITHMKGSDLFLKMSAQLKKCLPSTQRVKFLVVATTDDRVFYEKFLHERERLSLQNDVCIVENVTDVLPYYTMMDAYVSTARQDPFPLVIMEAMAAGKPVLAFEVGGIPEALVEDSGILVPFGDVDQMTAALVNIIQQNSLRRELGSKARQFVMERFDLSRNISFIQSIIERQQ